MAGRKTATAKKTTNKKTGLGDKPIIMVPDKTKEQILLDEIVWVSKAKRGWSRYDNGRKDIYISLNKHKSKPRVKDGKVVDYVTLNMSFRDGIEKTITKSGYIMFGVCKNRLYFKEASITEGYRVTPKGGTTAGMSMHIGSDAEKVFAPFAKHEFHLKYDDFQELYYVELEK